MAEDAQLDEARRRRVIYMPGDPGDAIYFVNSGRIKISRVTPDGKELTLAYRSTGDIFGEVCLADGRPREEMAEAMESTLITALSRARFERLVSQHVRLSYELVKVLADRRREMERRTEDLVFKDVNAKLAELLLGLGHDYGIADARGTMVSMKITHQEMANLIGSTRETVSLTLSHFKKTGLIANDGRKMIITDRAGLQALM